MEELESGIQLQNVNEKEEPEMEAPVHSRSRSTNRVFPNQDLKSTTSEVKIIPPDGQRVSLEPRFDPMSSSAALNINLSKINKIKDSSFYRKGYSNVSKADIYRIFETVEDNQVNEFKSYLFKYKNIKKKFMKILDLRKRNMIHIAAYRGSIQVLKILLRNYQELDLSIDQPDINGDNPLELACIRGYDARKTEYYFDKKLGYRTSKRYKVVSMLLDYRNSDMEQEIFIKVEKLKKDANTPLHWAIYWSDIDLASLVFEQCPGQIFNMNKHGFIPFDMCFQTGSRLTQFKSQLILFYLLDEIFYFLKASKEDKTIAFISRLDLSSANLRKASQKKIHLRMLINNLMTESQCYRLLAQLMRSEQETREDFIAAKMRFKEAHLKIIDHQKEITKKSVGVYTYYVQRFALWYAFFKREKQFLSLMKHFSVSPFAISSNKRSTIHMLCLENNHRILELLMMPTYEFIGIKPREFNLKEALSVTSGFGINTALHHAAIHNSFRCFKLLRKKGLSLKDVNYRGWTPVQLSFSKVRYFKHLRQEIRRDELIRVASFDPVNQLTCSYEKLLEYNSKYQYCIISVADSYDIYDTTVYKQLKTIQKVWASKGELIIDAQNGFDNLDLYKIIKKKANMNSKLYDKYMFKNHFIYKLRLSKELAGYLAERLKMRVFNLRYRYQTQYKQMENKYYEPLRDIQKQRILIYLILSEFNIFKFQNAGLILDHFPLHHFGYRKHIDEYWKKYFWATILNSIRVGKRAVGFRAIAQIGFYHGLQNGFYFGFLIQLTSLMFPLAIIGVAFYLYGILFADGFDNLLLPVMSIIVGIWMTLSVEGWKRREKHLAFNFDVLGIRKIEQKRIEYTGNYVVSQATKKVVKYDKFTPFKRRAMTEIPMLLLGFLMILPAFLLNDWLIDKIDERETNKEITATVSFVLQSIAGAMNGLIVVIENAAYRWIVSKVVNWENHEYESQMLNSIVLKNVFFQFLSSYFTLLVYCFVLIDFKRASTQMGSMMISKNFFNIVTSNLWPFLQYAFKTKLFYKRWNKYRKDRKEKFLKFYQIEDVEKFEDLQNIYIKHYAKKERTDTKDDESLIKPGTRGRLQFSLPKINLGSKSKLNSEERSQIDASKQSLSIIDLEKVDSEGEKLKFISNYDPEERKVEISKKVIEPLDKRNEKRNKELISKKYPGYESLANIYIEFERKLVSKEQIEMSRFMMDMDKSIETSFMNLAIQYGYLGMFMPLFPAAAFFGLISNVAITTLTARAYSNIAKRSLSREVESIGVWNDIFMIISFVSTVVNALIVAFTATKMESILGDITTRSRNSTLQSWFTANAKAYILVVVFLAEHSIIIFKYTLSKLIPDIPERIRVRKNHTEYFEQMAQERINQKRQKGNIKAVIKDMVKSKYKRKRFMGTIQNERLMKKMKRNGILRPMLMLGGVESKEIDVIDNKLQVKVKPKKFKQNKESKDFIRILKHKIRREERRNRRKLKQENPEEEKAKFDERKRRRKSQMIQAELINNQVLPNLGKDPETSSESSISSHSSDSSHSSTTSSSSSTSSLNSNRTKTSFSLSSESFSDSENEILLPEKYLKELKSLSNKAFSKRLSLGLVKTPHKKQFEANQHHFMFKEDSEEYKNNTESQGEAELNQEDSQLKGGFKTIEIEQIPELVEEESPLEK